MGAGKCEPGDLEECRNTVAKVRKSGDRHLLGEVQSGRCYALFNSSEYREAQQSSDEGFALLLEGLAENPFLSSHYQSYSHLKYLCHIYLGEWGEALRTLERRVEILKKNGEKLTAIAVDVSRQRLCVYAMDFVAAHLIAESTLALIASFPIVMRQALIFAGAA